MKIYTKISFLIFIILILSISCINEPKKEVIKEKDSISDVLIKTPSIKNIEKLPPKGIIETLYGDSIDFKIDTITTNEYTAYYIGGKSAYSFIMETSFRIFVFKNRKLSIDFFHDLQAQFYLKSEGINKSRNYIVRSDSIIYWKRIPASVAHKFDKIKEIHWQIIKNDFNVKDADSLVSHHNYRIKKWKKTQLNKTFSGKWKSVHYCSVFKDTSYFVKIKKQHALNLFDNKIMNLKKDTFFIDSVFFIIRNFNSLKFPNSKFYLKHYKGATFSSKTKKKTPEIQRLQKREQALIEFVINYKRGARTEYPYRLKLLKFKDIKTIFLITDTELFKLKRIN